MPINPDGRVVFVVPAARLRRALLILIFSLAALSFAGQMSSLFLHQRLGGLVRIFDVDAEASLPNWYSSLALAVAAALLGAIAASPRARGDARDRTAWTALAVIFAALSLDEIAGIHEGVGKQVKQVLHLGGWFHYAWVLPALVLLPLVGATFLPFLSRLAPRRRRQFIVAGSVFVGGCVGMEIIGGRLASAEGGTLTFAYAVCFHLEESLEMLGIVLFNAALIEHLAEQLGSDGLTLRFTKD